MSHVLRTLMGMNTAEGSGGWSQWQAAVVDVIRQQFDGLFASVGLDDVDWPAWRWLFDAGCTPQAAVHEAFTLDL